MKKISKVLLVLFILFSFSNVFGMRNFLYHYTNEFDNYIQQLVDYCIHEGCREKTKDLAKSLMNGMIYYVRVMNHSFRNQWDLRGDSSYLDSCLLSEAKSDSCDFKKALSFLEMGANIDARVDNPKDRYYGMTSLMIVSKDIDIWRYEYPKNCRKKKLSLAMRLIGCGADVNAKVNNPNGRYHGFTPLMQLCKNEPSSKEALCLVMLLVDNGANFNVRLNNPKSFDHSFTPFMTLCFNYFWTGTDAGLLIGWMVDMGADVNKKVSNPKNKYHGYTPLMLICRLRGVPPEFIPSCIKMIDNGADLNARFVCWKDEYYGFTNFMVFLLKSRTFWEEKEKEKVSLLFKMLERMPARETIVNARVDSVNKVYGSFTPIMIIFFVYQFCPETIDAFLVKKMIKMGANVNLKVDNPESEYNNCTVFEMIKKKIEKSDHAKYLFEIGYYAEILKILKYYWEHGSSTASKEMFDKGPTKNYPDVLVKTFCY